MRRLANGLLLAMTVLFVVSNVCGDQGLVWGYVRAFAEAAMVGGLADWFAVTAIFRRPLGLPIPHTAVIPRNQKRIADSVGDFIADNFLEPELVERRVANNDLSMGIAKWLSDPVQAKGLAAGATSAIPGVLDALDDATVAEFLRAQMQAAGGARLAPLFGSVIETLARQGRHQAILDAALAEGFRMLEANRDSIREKVSERSGWLFRMLSVDRKVADTMMGAIEDLLYDAARDQNHPLRRRVTEIVEKFALDLRDDPALQARIDQWVRDALAHESVQTATQAAWTELKSALRADCLAADSRLRAWLEQTFENVGKGLLHDATVRNVLNERLRLMMVDAARNHGKDVSRLVSETIRAWDAQTIIVKLETSVGRDLQYIRLNGTLIGGVVGLILHLGASLL